MLFFIPLSIDCALIMFANFGSFMLVLAMTRSLVSIPAGNINVFRCYARSKIDYAGSFKLVLAKI